MLFRSRVLALALSLFLFASLATPHRSWGFLDFSEDALKTTGIIIGITAGVVLLVVLIAGTVRDIKGGEEEEEDIWANLRENRTLSSFPSLMAGAVLADDLRNAFASPGADSPTLQDRAQAGDARIPDGLGHSFQAFRIGGSEILLADPQAADRPPPPRDPPGDALRFALLLQDTAGRGDSADPHVP